MTVENCNLSALEMKIGCLIGQIKVAGSFVEKEKLSERLRIASEEYKETTGEYYKGT
jgi:hypothetical protein